MAGDVHSGKISGFGIFLLCLFLIWTGILLWAGSRQYQINEEAEQKLREYLVSQGSVPADVIQYLKEQEEPGIFARFCLSGNSILSYLLSQSEELEKVQEKNMVRLAEMFSGKYYNNGFLQSASGDMAVGYHLFAGTDETSSEEENEEEVPAIALFCSGSPDITMDNQVVIKQVEKKSEQDSICDIPSLLKENQQMIQRLKITNSRSYLLKKFYITDSSTSIDNRIFQVKTLLNMDMKLKKENKPQILIFHTHGGSEAFVDSRKGKKEDSIVGVGGELAQVLSEQYGYQVLHDKTEYDRINGQIDRNKAYNNALAGVSKTLEKYPSIEVVIDLHRDGVGNKVNRTTIINGKKTAQAMFFNGLSRNASGNIAYLKNDNLQGNLAFSLQLKLACMERFQNFAKPVYLKGYRYNMHLKKRFTLIELGNENNTVEEAKNAMAPLAMVIDAVLSGK